MPTPYLIRGDHIISRKHTHEEFFSINISLESLILCFWSFGATSFGHKLFGFSPLSLDNIELVVFRILSITLLGSA